jgi:hypothetical protein
LAKHGHVSQNRTVGQNAMDATHRCGKINAAMESGVVFWGGNINKPNAPSIPALEEAHFPEAQGTFSVIEELKLPSVHGGLLKRLLRLS